jgi:hypothetical protein
MPVTAETIREAAVSHCVREAPPLTLEQGKAVAILLGLVPLR